MSLLIAIVGAAIVAALPFWLATRKRPERELIVWPRRWLDDPLAVSMAKDFGKCAGCGMDMDWWTYTYHAECIARLPEPAYRCRPVIFMDGLRLRSFRRVRDRAPRRKPYPNHRRKTVEVTTFADDRRRFVYADGAS